MPVLLFIFGALGAAIAAVVAPIYLDLLRRELSRSERIERVARGLGLGFSPVDPAYPSSSALVIHSSSSHAASTTPARTS